ncbi:MAG: NAD+ synthase [Deltaproteobacteria bacterium]
MKDQIIDWIRRRTRACGASGVVFGLSGGIDSCVAGVLARKALGRDRVLALCLPCHSQEQDLRDALAVTRKSDIRHRVIDLTAAYDSLIAVLPPADRLTRANIRPRLRMITLYYLAKKLGFLVLGTSNKTEIMTGYFTKFGDGASDLLPLGALYKGQVRQLARELKIPEAIIAKPPTAGLWPGQTDEGEMGVTYPEIDDILARMEKGKRQTLSAGKVRKVRGMVECSRHKRVMPEVFKP